MKKLLITALLLAAVVPASSLPAAADDKTDAYNLCVKDLSSHMGLPRAEVKQLSVRSNGAGFEMSGSISNSRHVSCVVRNGRITDIVIS